MLGFKVLFEIVLSEVVVDCFEIVKLITELIETLVECCLLLGVKSSYSIPFITNMSKLGVELSELCTLLIALE